MLSVYLEVLYWREQTPTWCVAKHRHHQRIIRILLVRVVPGMTPAMLHRSVRYPIVVVVVVVRQESIWWRFARRQNPCSAQLVKSAPTGYHGRGCKAYRLFESLNEQAAATFHRRME